MTMFLVTTNADWRAGAQAALDVRSAKGQPLWGLLELRSSSFVEGFTTRWNDVKGLTEAQFDAVVASGVYA